MRKILLLIIFSSSLLAQPLLPFYKRYEGRIGMHAVVLNLTAYDSVLGGNYYYVKYGEPVLFGYASRINSGGSFYLEAEAGTGNETFRGIIKDSTAEGYWRGANASDSLKFLLHEIYPRNSENIKLKSYSLNEDSLVYIGYGLPEVTGAVQIPLEDSIKEIFFGEENVHDLSQQSITRLMRDYIERYKQEVLIDTLFGNFRPSYYSNSKVNVFFNSGGLLCLELSSYKFEGGAHGNYFIRYLNFDIINGRAVSFEDIFLPDYEEALRNAAEKAFREKYKIRGNEFASQGWFGFEDGFFVNDNIALCSGGIMIRYNPYEAGAWALGAPYIYIPYKKLKSIIIPDGILSRLVSE